MHRKLIATASVVSVLACLSSAASADDTTRLADAVGECASVTATARNYGYGYNHIVTLSNHCARAVSCEVWTNVDPSPHLTLKAKPGETSETTARVGSPAREVQAGKACHFEG